MESNENIRTRPGAAIREHYRQIRIEQEKKGYFAKVSEMRLVDMS